MTNRLREGLMADHLWLDEALVRLGFAAESGDAGELQHSWNELESGLTTHLELEERELFPLVEPFHPEGVRALRNDHELIKRRIADLGVEVDLHAVRKQTVDDLVETLRRHSEKEDRTLYHWLETNVPEDSRRHLLGLLARTVRADLREERPVRPS
jgi:hemerythrin-like domain-containing protein